MDCKYVRGFLINLGFCLLVMSWHASYGLTLKRAEQAAIEQSPELKSLAAKTHALEQSAIAAGQLSDPTLMLGTMNVPVDSFNFSQEPMTQIQVGLQQSFPRGCSLLYQDLKQKQLAGVQFSKGQVMRLTLLQRVGLIWFQLYFWTQARSIVEKQKNIFKHLMTVARSALANNKAQQKDVLRAQLELTELDNQLLEINQHIAIARAALARWIGPRLAQSAYPNRLPRWARLPTKSVLNAHIHRHAVLNVDERMVKANKANVSLAKQQYKPGYKVGLNYGIRQGRNLNNSKRSDFFSAQVSIDLPVFRVNRQDRILKASEDKLFASEETKMSDYRQLRQALITQGIAWQQQQKRALLYRTRLVPEAKHYAEATMIAYQNTKSDFPTLARAYVRKLSTELAGLKATVDRETARIHLLYLQGQ